MNFLCLLEIPDFLDESECNHIISLAEKVGLRGSDVHLDEELEKSKEVVRGNRNFVWIHYQVSKCLNKLSPVDVLSVKVNHKDA